MRKTLGKIWLFTVLSPLLLFGGVSLRVDRAAIYAGDTVTFTIQAEGGDVKLPDIADVGGFSILSTSNGSNVQIINGSMTKSLSRSYTFAPMHDVTIPAYTVTIGGKDIKTQPQAIKVLKPSASSAGDPYVLEMKLQQSSAHVGEPVQLAIIFKQKINAKPDRIEINEPSLQDFWVKKVGGVQQGVEGEYATQTYRYILFPKKAGSFTIPATFARVGTSVRQNMGGPFDNFFKDPFFSTVQTQWKKVFSNEPTLTVTPLPQNSYLYGDFALKATVDKTEVNANKPVNLTVTVEGSGNIDDIAKFSPDIPEAVLYADAPKIEGRVDNDRYVGSFTEHVAIVGDRNFTIPSLELTYFDAKSQKVITKHTDPISIHVKGAPAAQQAPKLQAGPTPTLESAPTAGAPVTMPQTVPTVKPLFSGYGMLAVGVALGALLGGLFVYLFGGRMPAKRSEKESDMAQEVKHAKNDKALFALLLPHAKQYPELSKPLKLLEANLYQGTKHPIDRKKIAQIVNPSI